MKIAFAAALAATAPLSAQELSKAQPVPIVDTIPAARDVAFPGKMTLEVDITDTDRGIFRVRQTIPVAAAGPMTLLFPKWLPGSHAPRGEIEKLVGLTITAGSKSIAWTRDPIDMHAFHVDVPAGAKALDIAFAFASATETDQGRVVATPAMVNLQWQSVSLYPAGWFTRNIPVDARLIRPRDWGAGTALRPRAVNAAGNVVDYQTVSYETLVDSPVFAGRWFRAEDLGHGVTLNIVADAEANLAATPAQIDAHKRLVDQAVKLFGTKPFDRYDFLLALTSQMSPIGIEHHRSSENGVNPEYFTEWETGPGRRNLLPHELTHSWNGKYRRPADLFTPDFRAPMRNSLLWVYEGQTQFWGYVLGARSGLFSKQETLDALAAIAATLDIRRAREWRNLADTTNDPIITARRPKGWLSYQRSEDYYNEGMLIWLETDAILREKSRGTKSMDDFARAFFAGREGDWGVRTYDFEEVVRTLNAVVPHDWARFLRMRLTELAGTAPIAGLTRSGYRLTYSDTPTPFFKDAERRAKEANLSFSIGVTIGRAGKVEGVIWGSPAFEAGLTTASELVAVNGVTYSDDALKAAIVVAKGRPDPIRLTLRTGERVRDVNVSWNGGLRYPRLEKISSAEGGLDRLLATRP